MASSELPVSEGKKGVSSTVPTKPQQHKRMPSTHQRQEDLLNLLILSCSCSKLLDVLYGSEVALIIAPMCVWIFVAIPSFLHQKDYALPSRKQFTLTRNVLSVFSLPVLRSPLIFCLSAISMLEPKTIKMMWFLTTWMIALWYGVKLSRFSIVRVFQIVVASSPSLPPIFSIFDLFSTKSQDLEQQVDRTADVPRLDLRDSAPACAATSSSPPCKNNASESAVDTAANPRCSANDHEETALPKGGETIPPSPAKTAHAWVIDAGAPCHVTGDRELLRDLHPSVLPERLLMASGLHLPVVGTGSVQTDRITLPNVPYAPGLLVNSISVAQLFAEHSLATFFEADVLYIKKTASAEIIGQASVDGSGLYVLDYLHLTGTACRTSSGSHPHLDAEAEPCGIDSGHSSSQSTATATGQQAMPAYACRTKDEDQMPVALTASSSTQAGGHPVVLLDSGACFHITGFGEDLQNPEHMTGSVVGISGTALPVTGQGSIMGTRFPIWLDKVRYVHGQGRLIVSVSQLTRERSARVVFEPDYCRVERTSDNWTIGCGKRVGDLYTLECLTPG